MFVKIRFGVYGHNVNGRVVPMRAGEVVEVDDAIGDRLIACGIAAYVVTDDEPTPETEDDKNEQDTDDAAAFPEYNDDMTRKELEAIALEMGAEPEEVTDARNKAALLAMLDALREEFEAEGHAPMIDAAAAIQ